MGFYVDPLDESKESFLKREGALAPYNQKISWASVPKGFVPVVLLDNGRFTAAGIAYCERELDAFTGPNDRRPRTIYLVKTEKLFPVTDIHFQRYAKENGLL
jgi:hypothetical protein